MKPFDFLEPRSIAEAVTLLGAEGTRAIAGGSDLLGELKEGTAHYQRLVSLARIPGTDRIEAFDGGLRIGAGVTLAALEREPRLRGPYQILAEAARGVATPEIRNQGTLGGNLCQRPRCLHFRSPWVSCLKKGGTDCPAAASIHQHYLAVLGGQGCHAVHASDLAPPLLALDATLIIAGKSGERRVPVAEFFAGPEHDVTRENRLAPDELVTAVLLPAQPAQWRGVYTKGRDRTAGDFPLVSVAFGCAREGARLRNVRLVLGAVAPVPWRCTEAEMLLEGQTAPPGPAPELALRAAQAAFARATPLAHNGFKVQMGQALIARVIVQVASAP